MAPTDPLQGHVGKETKGCLLLRASQSTLVLKANGLLTFPSHVLNTMRTPMTFHTLNQPLRNALLLLVLPKMRNAITMP